MTATMTAQLEEQSVSVSRDLAARSTDPILLNDLLGLHDLLDETHCQQSQHSLRFSR
ncbi:MAG: hypothetical protein MZV65_36000 [Chromatiales bacterium]|nr:hypothetical protein [Chromatiales bacterium]